MVRLFAVFVLAGALTTLGACLSERPTGPAEVVRGDSVVSMPGFTFTPFSLAIKVGGTVLFDFPSEPHNVIFAAVTGAPNDIQATVNRIVARRFDVIGEFPYDCTIHPGMSGEIIVEQ